MAADDAPDLEADPPAWAQIERFELDEPFWTMVKSVFGYGEDSPTLQNLLIRLLVSDYAYHLAKELPGALQHLQLPRSGTANAVVCLAQWRDSSSKRSSYAVLADEVGALLHMPDHLHGCGVEELLDVMTFLAVEKSIVQGLLDRVTSTADAINPEAIGNIVHGRQDGHWVSSGSVPGEFVGSLPDIALEGVAVLKLDEIGALAGPPNVPPLPVVPLNDIVEEVPESSRLKRVYGDERARRDSGGEAFEVGDGSMARCVDDFPRDLVVVEPFENPARAILLQIALPHRIGECGSAQHRLNATVAHRHRAE